jgi:type IX secretion system PorP/SprF family membrane protein
MKKILLWSIAIMSVVTVFGQQDPQFTQNYFNRFYPNPAVAGSNDGICATLIGRQQWVGFEGRPESYLFTAHMPFTDPWLNQSHGVGFSVLSDRLGQESTFGFKVSYAYRRAVGPGMLSGGIGLGLINKTINNDWDAVDDFQVDPSIPDNGASDLSFDMDFGLYYKIPKKAYVGVSVTHLNGAVLQDEDENAASIPANLEYGMARHIYVMAGYQTQIISPDWQIKPNVFIKSDGVSTTFDIAGLIEYQERFWGGINYRLQDAIGPILGVNYQMPGTGLTGGILKVGYSYDVTTSQLRKHSSGSHELMVNYCMNIISKPKFERHRTVRFL